MGRLSPHEITVVFLALGTLLGAARVLAEVARRLRQPAVLGEIVAGLLLGPTLLGRLAPDLSLTLFPPEGGAALFLDGFVTLAAALFLLVAGMEVELGRVFRQGRAALAVSLSGIVVPFGLGFVAGWAAPGLMGREPQADRMIFALFFATALSISSLPVIARTLLDLNLFRTDIGVVIVAAAIVQDLVGWIVFAVILGMIDAKAGHGLPIAATIPLTLGFALVMLTAVRWLVHRALPWVQAHASWPGGVLGFALCLALFSAAFTEWIGVHAIFGTFMAGVAIGDSSHLRKRTRTTIDQFISSIFAPLFFASVGLKVDFLANFDLVLALVVLVIACVGKVIGAGLGARLAGMGSREAWSIGYGMNARGAMEIVLGLLALQAGVIGERLFVALVVMALVTSIISGPLIQRTMGRHKTYRLRDHLSARGFVGALRASDREGAIRELIRALGVPAGLDPEGLAEAVLARERVVGSGLERGLAIPSVRLERIPAPVVALGLSAEGIDFDAPDGSPARIVCLLLIPGQDHEAQWGIMADIGRTFASSEVRERVLDATSYVELLAALNWGEPSTGPRRGVVVVGAGPLARAVGKKLTALSTPAWLVDINRDHCQAAQREGLSVVQGNALRDAVLFQAHAFEAQGLLALTPNAEVNAGAARLAREEFAIPQVVAAAAAGELPAPAGVCPIGAGALGDWERWVAAADWVTLPVGKGDPGELMALAARASADAQPLLLLRGATAGLAWRGQELRAGDQVLALRRRESSLEPPERLARALPRGLVLDLPEPLSVGEALKRAAGELTRHAGQALGTVAPPAAERITELAPWLAVCRLNSSRPHAFEVGVARARLSAEGPVRALVLLASSPEESRTHLEALATLAQRAEDPELERRFAAAPIAELLQLLFAPSPAGSSAGGADGAQQHLA